MSWFNCPALDIILLLFCFILEFVFITEISFAREERTLIKFFILIKNFGSSNIRHMEDTDTWLIVSHIHLFYIYYFTHI